MFKNEIVSATQKFKSVARESNQERMKIKITQCRIVNYRAVMIVARNAHLARTAVYGPWRAK